MRPDFQKPPAHVYALRVIYPAILAAMLLIGQVAFRIVPNVEIVTVLIIVSAFVFPPYVVLSATAVFCTGQWLIYGFGYWIIAYCVYWPLLASVSVLLKMVPKKLTRAVAAVVIAVLATALFGVLTSAVDAWFMSAGLNAGYFQCFSIVYMRGAWFYAIHTASNAAIVGVLFTPLSASLKRVVSKHFSTQ